MEHGRFIDKPAQVERDESAPAWAKGYDVEDLKRITTVFKRHDEGQPSCRRPGATPGRGPR
jgi:hypothetical protein